MKKTTALIFGIVIIMLISGCAKSSSRGSNPITDADVRKGFDGLDMEFVKNAPPDKLFEETTFPISIKLSNKGAYSIKNGFVAVNFDRSYMDFEGPAKELMPFEVAGKSVFDLKGSDEYITFNGQTKKVGVQSEKQLSTMIARACHEYQTILGASICVDTDIFGNSLRKKSCEAKDLEFANGQGAPVAITKIEVRMLPEQSSNKVKPHLILHIENKGKGQVITQSKVQEACTKTPLKLEDFNRIMIRASLSGSQLNCDTGLQSGEARLREKKDTVRCTLEEGIDRTQDAFMAPLRIEMDYGYTSAISKDITIEKILRH